MASTDWIIVDDSDPSVEYGSGWLPSNGALQPEFSQTTHVPVTDGASLTFAFIGTAIEVYGSISNGRSQEYVFSVDGNSQEYNASGLQLPALTYHVRHFQMTGLSDGNHTLTVTSKTDTDQIPFSSIDYIKYLRSSSTPVNDATRFVVDETDSKINYVGQWSSATTSEYFGGSSKQVTVARSQADIKFTGQAIEVYGTLTNASTREDMLQCSFEVDESSPTTTQYSPPATATFFNTQLYQSNDLNEGEHTLSIKSLNNQPLSIDYFLVHPGGQPSRSATSPPPTSSNKHVPVGAIVGGAVGGVVLLALWVVGALLWKRRTSRPTRRTLPAVEQVRPYVTERSSSTVQSTNSTVGDTYPLVTHSDSGFRTHDATQGSTRPSQVTAMSKVERVVQPPAYTEA